MFSIGDSKLKLHLPIFLGLEHAWKCRLGEHIIVYKNTKMLEKNTKATTAIGKHRNQMLFSGSKFRPGDVFLSVQWLLLHWWWMQTWHGGSGLTGNGASWNRKSQGKILLEKTGTRNSGVLKFETQNWWLKMYSTPPNTTHTWINIGWFVSILDAKEFYFEDSEWCVSHVSVGYIIMWHSRPKR